MQICGVARGLHAVPVPPLHLQKPKLKPGKSLPLGVEELGQLPPAEGPGGRPLRKSFRRGESWSWPGDAWGRACRQALECPLLLLVLGLRVCGNRNKCRSRVRPQKSGKLPL